MSKETAPRTPEPIPLPVLAENIPDAIRALPAVLWKYEERYNEKKDEWKWTKVPRQLSGVNASSTRPETWTTFDQAYAQYITGQFREVDETPSGVGVPITKQTGIVAIDLDKVVNPETGELDHEAALIVRSIDTYTELSPSGTGLRMFIYGMLPDECPRNKNGREVYDSGKYLTLTGHHIGGTPSTVNHFNGADLRVLLYGLPAKRVTVARTSSQPSNQSDQDILQRAKEAQNSTKFEALYYSGDLSYNENNPSQADQALCCMIAFWTQDAAQVDRIFRDSALFRPEKWDKKHYADGTTYGAKTVERAIALAGTQTANIGGTRFKSKVHARLHDAFTIDTSAVVDTTPLFPTAASVATIERPAEPAIEYEEGTL